jgi:hypothetical protein
MLMVCAATSVWTVGWLAGSHILYFLPIVLLPVWLALVLRGMVRALLRRPPVESREHPHRVREWYALAVLLLATSLRVSGIGPHVVTFLLAWTATPEASYLWNEVPAVDSRQLEGWQFVGPYFGYVYIQPSGVYISIPACGWLKYGDAASGSPSTGEWQAITDRSPAIRR